MDDGKKNKGKSVLIIILLVVILILGVYIYLSHNKKESCVNNESYNSGNYITDFTKLPKKSDDNVKEITNGVPYTEFLTDNDLKKNGFYIEKSKNNFSIVFRCNYYDQDKKTCSSVSALIDNAFTIDDFYDLDEMGCTKNYKILKTNDYYVVIEGDGCGPVFEITVKKNNLKLSFNAVSSIDPVIVNNVLYFNRYSDSGGRNSFIDLSKDELNNIISIK